MTGLTEGGSPKIVFVLGFPRSGTTLLTEMLASAEEVTATGETHFMRRFWRPAMERGEPLDSSAWSTLVEDFLGSGAFELSGLDPGSFTAEARNLPKRPLELLRCFLRQVARKAGTSFVIEKTPHHVRYVSELKDAFPDSTFIHIVRDPRACIRSWRSVPWSTGSLRSDAELWRRHVRAGRLAEKRHGVICVRYEDLARQPTVELDRLCRAIGLKFSPSMAHRSGTSISFDPAAEPWKARAIQPVSTERIDRWRSELDPASIATIEGTVWREMCLRGYEPHNSRTRLVALWLYTLVWRNLKRVGYRISRAMKS